MTATELILGDYKESVLQCQPIEIYVKKLIRLSWLDCHAGGRSGRDRS